MSWMLDMFKRPPPQHIDRYQRQAELDASAIESMHSGGSGTVKHPDAMAEAMQTMQTTVTPVKPAADANVSTAVKHVTAPTVLQAISQASGAPTKEPASSTSERFDPEVTTQPTSAAKPVTASVAHNQPADAKASPKEKTPEKNAPEKNAPEKNASSASSDSAKIASTESASSKQSANTDTSEPKSAPPKSDKKGP
jgi:hypothetical protein